MLTGATISLIFISLTNKTLQQIVLYLLNSQLTGEEERKLLENINA